MADCLAGTCFAGITALTGCILGPVLIDAVDSVQAAWSSKISLTTVLDRSSELTIQFMKITKIKNVEADERTGTNFVSNPVLLQILSQGSNPNSISGDRGTDGGRKLLIDDANDFAPGPPSEGTRLHAELNDDRKEKNN